MSESPPIYHDDDSARYDQMARYEKSMKKPPYIWLYLTFYLKHAPKDYRGIVRDNWNCGRDEPVPLGKLVHDIAMLAATFNIETGTLSEEEVNAQLREAATTINESIDRIEAKEQQKP